MTRGPSCTEHARAYHRAIQAGITIENDDDVIRKSTDNHSFDDYPSFWDIVPPISYDSNTTQVDTFDQPIALIPSMWIGTMARCNCVYCGLHDNVLEEIEEAFLNANHDEKWTEAATRVLRRFRDWKYESLSQDAIEHEAAAASAFDLESPIRSISNKERDGLVEATNPHECQLMSAIRELSVDVLRSYFGFPITLYRGMGYHLQSIAEDIFTNPSQQEYFQGEWKCTISNFTPDPDIGCHFSEVALRVESEPQSVLSAPDFLTSSVVYYDNEGVWRLVSEGEIRLATDKLGAIHREDICAARATDISLPDAIEAIPPTITAYDPSSSPLFSTDQHRAIRQAALAFANFTIDASGLTVESVSPPEETEAALRIQTWFSIYDHEFTAEQPIDPKTNHVAEIIRKIVTAANEG